MAIPAKYRAEIDGSFYDLESDNRECAIKEARSIVEEKKLKYKDISSVYANKNYKAYMTYYDAIEKHGCNNNAAAAADKKGFNWTCDNTEMWHEARIDLGL